MRLLLDTHALLWWVTADRRLPKEWKLLLAEDHDVAVSSVSTWEIAIKSALGRIRLDLNGLIEAIGADGFEELPVRFAHTAQLRGLPRHHDDPFDRLLIAQAIVEGRKLVTRDEQIAAYRGEGGLDLL